MLVRFFRITCLFLGLALLITVPSLARPPFPYEPLGTVKVNGENVPPDTEVGAWCGGIQYTSSLVEFYEGETWYSLQVPGDDPETEGTIEGCTAGETVRFTVAYKSLVLEPSQTGTWVSDFEQINLTSTVFRVYLPLILR